MRIPEESAHPHSSVWPCPLRGWGSWAGSAWRGDGFRGPGGSLPGALRGGYGEGGTRCFMEVSSRRTGHNGHELEERRFWLEIRRGKKSLWRQEQVVQRDCGSLSLEISQTWLEDPEQLGLNSVLSLGQEAGLLRCLPVWLILCFCENVKIPRIQGHQSQRWVSHSSVQKKPPSPQTADIPGLDFTCFSQKTSESFSFPHFSVISQTEFWPPWAFAVRLVILKTVLLIAKCWAGGMLTVLPDTCAL